MTVHPRDLPHLRDETVRNLRAHADLLRARADDPRTRDLYVAASGHDPLEAAIDTETIARHLRVASLWWATSAMTDVALDASRDLPDWTPAQAVPDDIGLILWEGGMPALPWTGAPDSAFVDGPLGPRPPLVPLDGVLWSLIGGRLRVHMLTLGAPIATHLHGGFAGMPLFEFGEIASPTGDGVVRGLDPDTPTPVDDRDMGRVLAAVGATWLLMTQETVADRTRLDPAPKLAAAYARAQRETPAVTLVDLRRARTPDAEDRADVDEGRIRHLKHRHVVRGHWRQQPCGPEHSQRRPTWIHPFVKGPDGAPFVRSDVVRVWRR